VTSSLSYVFITTTTPSPSHTLYYITSINNQKTPPNHHSHTTVRHRLFICSWKYIHSLLHHQRIPPPPQHHHKDKKKKKFYTGYYSYRCAVSTLCSFATTLYYLNHPHFTTTLSPFNPTSPLRYHFYTLTTTPPTRTPKLTTTPPTEHQNKNQTILIY
jgi:hypothetical protein